MSNIKNAFRNGKALIPFITCGDPDLETTGKIVRAMAANGADLIELGIPFSDPTAEGPVIQAANLRALEGCVTTDKIFDFVKELRKDVSIPMVFMTYSNVVFSYGYEQSEELKKENESLRADGTMRRAGAVQYTGSEKFISKCAEIGIDGLILPDLPYEEKGEFADICSKYGVDLISLIASTSENRIAMIAKEAEGFIYVVSSLGVTGTRTEIKSDIAAMTKVIRENTDVPCAVGFGISNPETAGRMAKVSDGAIVGSAIVKIAEQYGRDAAEPIGKFVAELKTGMQ
ncbi:MAG: tryptophan synthase subunit alpha [Lachnospiraceae bacterium]|nr:tryptophan synthase subunit alpha [Lachnospiraceae bacterium]